MKRQIKSSILLSEYLVIWIVNYFNYLVILCEYIVNVNYDMSGNTTKPTKVACVPHEDPDELEHPPSLNRVFAVHFKGS